MACPQPESWNPPSSENAAWEFDESGWIHFLNVLDGSDEDEPLAHGPTVKEDKPHRITALPH